MAYQVVVFYAPRIKPVHVNAMWSTAPEAVAAAATTVYAATDMTIYITRIRRR